MRGAWGSQALLLLTGSSVVGAWPGGLGDPRSSGAAGRAPGLGVGCAGVDICGRTVMVLVGRNIPVAQIDIEKALLYFIHVMDHIVVKEYVLVYFHTLTGEHNHLDSDFLKKLYDIVDGKYKKNLQAFYFVHPTFRYKVSTWFFTTFNVSSLKDKVHHVELFTCILPEQIDIPPFVLEYDTRTIICYDHKLTETTCGDMRWESILVFCRIQCFND
ncbi:Ganglioside-induced differentiation-associated protein 2 [Acipenser ruthenus]|uniref:Ganglioside-induced differentiation-associated protein 2 n=1 Tax=Acipenser ruthenus TaxID=7906 RepID=A0A444UFG4_ACIRT|nr:Ganglioside-induced differentiation-associated protein 2 [Acipenser ruthenus]